MTDSSTDTTPHADMTIEAGPAFGSGAHPSTILAAQLIQRLAEFQREGYAHLPHTLDMGCGSGVLSIYAAQQLSTHVLAADIQPESLQATDNNAKHNGLSDKISTTRSDGYHAAEIGKHAPYPLIIANVLADILIHWAPATEKHLADNGFLIVSGVLVWRRDDVVTAHTMQGLALLEEHQADDWCAFLFHKSSDDIATTEGTIINQ